MDKLNHLRITVVFIITILVPSLFLSAFAYQAIEGERVARRIERRRHLGDEAIALARDLDASFRAPARDLREACARLRGRLRRPQDAALLLRASVGTGAVSSLALFAPDGRRVFPATRASLQGSPVPAAAAGLGASALLAATPEEAVTILEEAGEATRALAERRPRASERLRRLEVGASPGVRVAVALEASRLLVAANDEDETAVASMGLSRIAPAPLDLVDPLGRPVAALARLDRALVAAALRDRPLYRERLVALVRDLERDAAFLPAKDVSDLASRAASLLENEGPEWAAEARRATEVANLRRALEARHERLDEVFGADVREALRGFSRRAPAVAATDAGRPGGGAAGTAMAGAGATGGTDLAARAGLATALAGARPPSAPGSDASDPSQWFLRRRTGEREEVLLVAPLEARDGSLLGLAAFPVDLDAFARKTVVDRLAAHPGGEGEAVFEVTTTSLPTSEDDPDLGRSPLSYPLDHVQILARPRERGEDVLLRERTTMKLWLIALSIGGIAAGALVTTRTVLRESKAAELKSDFVTNVTHELRTPLTSIRMFIETLELGRVEDEEEAKECLQIMGRETDRLTRLIERLLAFSKIESRKWRFKFSYVEPLELVNEAIRVLRRQLGIKDGDPLPIEVESVQELPPVACDKDAIVEVLLNLLTNAWKYTPAQDRRLRIVLSARRKQVVIDVEDNGIGVPRRDRRRIWKKFERGSNAEKGRVEGSGIGLTLALSIAKGHGGTVTLTPLKVGSRFSLILPKV